MQVENNSWQLVGAGSEPKMIVQNVGSVRIAFTFSATQPGVNDIALDDDTGAHGILNPGTAPMTITDMNTSAVGCYVRALGPKAGSLYTFAG